MSAFLIDLAVKSTALLAAGTLMVLVMRRASASSRHLVWSGVLCAVALLPFSRISLPALNVAVLAPNVSLAPAPLLLPPMPLDRTALVTTPPPIETFTALTATAPPPARNTFSLSLADLVLAVWWLGIAALAVRAAAGHVVLRRLTSRATVVSDPRVLATLGEAANTFGVRRSISLLSHTDDGLPCTYGVVRPVILLPTSLLDADSEAGSRLRAVLIHETAHIARLDAISERITQVAVMMFWFNPLVWFAARQARFERERAADDAVLAGGAKASDYASDLLEIARTQSNPLWSSAVPMAVSALERRVRAILDDRVRRGRHSRASLAIAGTVLAAMLPVSAVRLVARAAPLPAAPRSAHTSSPAPRADASPSSSTVEQSDPLAVWNTERERNLRQVLRRGRAAQDEALTKVAIGTLAPTDVAVLETTVAQLEAAVKNFTLSTTPLTPKDLKSRRGVLAAAFSRLESSERRFTNGSLTTTALANALMTAARVIEPSIQVPGPSGGQMSSFFTLPPKGTPAGPKGYSFLAPAAEVAPASQNADQADPLFAWNAERLAKLKQVLERARKCYADSLTKVEIGTAAAIDVKTIETTVAQLEQMVLAFTPSATLPQPREVLAVSAAFAAAMKNVDAAQIRFDNGLLTNQEMANALMAAARTLGQHSNLEPAQEIFTSTNFPGSTDKDRNNAKALYDLLTGRVQSVTRELTDAELLAALKNAVNVASEDLRAQGLVVLAQKYAFTPEMAAAYVTAANSITAVSVRDRVFAQPVRLKSPGRDPGYYWQRRP